MYIAVSTNAGTSSSLPYSHTVTTAPAAKRKYKNLSVEFLPTTVTRDLYASV